MLRTLGQLTYAAGRRTFLASALGALLLAGCGSSGHRATTSPSTPTSTLALAAGQSGGSHRGVVNVYSADARRGPQSGRARRSGARVRAEQPEQHRRRDQPADVEDRRAVPGRGPAAARHALLRPADALRRQRPRQQPHADRPPYRQARAPDTGRGSVQPLLHSQRPVRDRRGGAAPAPRLPRSEHDAPSAFAAGARMPRGRSHGLLRRRALRVRELRVRRPDDRDRPQYPAGDPHGRDQPRRREPAGRQAVPRRPHPLHRRSAERRPVGDRPVLVPRDRLPQDRARAPTASTRAATRGSCTWPTARPARSRSSASGRGAWSRSGSCRCPRAPTWEVSRPTATRSG